MPAGKIDVHAHYLPEVYRDALVAEGQGRPDGIPALPDWSEAQAIDAMDKLDVRLAILSISSPGVHLVTPTPRRRSLGLSTKRARRSQRPPRSG
jgi:hypothetical protein